MAFKDTFYDILKWALIIGVSIAIAILVIGSLVIRDFDFIKKCPTKFFTETLLFGLFIGIPIIFIGKMRQAETKQTVLEFFMVFLKVVALHITLQMSGVYSQLYCKSRTDPDYSTVSPKPYIKNPFSPIIKEGITWGTIIGAILLIIGSFAVRDVEYIKKMPGTFISEGVMLAFFTTIPLLLIGYNRYAVSREKATQFFVVFAAIAAIHIGFQLSGVYSIIYKNA
jgi:hypothetical protein